MERISMRRRASRIEYPLPRPQGAAEQGVAAVEALELKVLYESSFFVDVRLAGERSCSANH
jgi:hypothetical protein